MSSREVHELSVRISEEGASDAQRELDQTSEQFNQVAENAKEAEFRTGQFQNRIGADRQAGVTGGAAGAGAGGLLGRAGGARALAAGVAGAGLLAGGAILGRTPIAGETGSAVDALVNAISLRVDESLRGTQAGNIPDVLFGTARDINRGQDVSAAGNLFDLSLGLGAQGLSKSPVTGPAGPFGPFGFVFDALANPAVRDKATDVAAREGRQGTEAAFNVGTDLLSGLAINGRKIVEETSSNLNNISQGLGSFP